MTEAEWLSCIDPRLMLAFLRGKASERKLRLFACDCCHRISDLLPNENSRWALKIANRFADGLARPSDLGTAREAAYQFYIEFSDTDEFGQFRGWEAASAAVAGACWAGAEDREEGLFNVSDNAFGLGRLSTGWRNGGQIEWRRQGRSLRDIFGNPFRPMTIKSTWLTPTSVTLAQFIYEELAFDRMPILGDALEEAGCDNAEILSHCRLDTKHVRGCWMIDAILGKA
jgi:hypothetical protein